MRKLGINTWLIGRLGEDKAGKLKAILGGLFIYILGNFPIATIVDGLEWNPVYQGYIMLIWSAFVIAVTSIIILFFGKSDMFPYPDKKEIVEDEKVETPDPEAEAEVIATDNANIDEPPT